jgi:hypothetical protein
LGRFFEIRLSSEAIAAVDRTISAGLEGDLAGLSACGANRIIHLTAAAVSSASLACVAAGLAALRLVCEAFLGVKLLLAGSKHEFFSAILADQGLVVEHIVPLKNNTRRLFASRSAYRIICGAYCQHNSKASQQLFYNL